MLNLPPASVIVMDVMDHGVGVIGACHHMDGRWGMVWHGSGRCSMVTAPPAVTVSESTIRGYNNHGKSPEIGSRVPPNVTSSGGAHPRSSKHPMMKRATRDTPG